jgi:hypothetical protein
MNSWWLSVPPPSNFFHCLYLYNLLAKRKAFLSHYMYQADFVLHTGMEVFITEDGPSQSLFLFI